MTIEHDYYTYNYESADKVRVYGWSIYPENSVLAGQPRKVLIEYLTEGEALKKYKGIQASNTFSEPQVSVNHLPGPEDYVPGGALPDDWPE